MELRLLWMRSIVYGNYGVKMLGILSKYYYGKSNICCKRSGFWGSRPRKYMTSTRFQFPGMAGEDHVLIFPWYIIAIAAILIIGMSIFGCLGGHHDRSDYYAYGGPGIGIGIHHHSDHGFFHGHHHHGFFDHDDHHSYFDHHHDYDDHYDYDDHGYGYDDDYHDF